jgi:hypothetical protein
MMRGSGDGTCGSCHSNTVARGLVRRRRCPANQRPVAELSQTQTASRLLSSVLWQASMSRRLSPQISRPAFRAVVEQLAGKQLRFRYL